MEEVSLSYFNEGLAFVEIVPSVVFQFILEIVVQRLRTPLVEEIINETYRREYDEVIVNPLAGISQENMNNVDDHQGSHHGDHQVQDQDQGEENLDSQFLTP